MVSKVYATILNEIVRTQAAEILGFRAALRELTECEVDRFEFTELFGYFSVKPAAYRIDQDSDGWHNVHVYEIKIGAPIPSWRLSEYARMADGDGPRFTLHIVNAYGQETIVCNDTLAALSFCDDSKIALATAFAENSESTSKKPAFATIVSGETLDLALLGSELNLSQKKNAAFRALKELGIVL